MAETGARWLPLLLSCIAHGPPAVAHRPAPFLLPLHAQRTGSKPLSGLYGSVAEAAERPGCHADLALGFTAAGTPPTGPAILAYGPDHATAAALADQLLASLVAAEPDCETGLLRGIASAAAAARA